MTDIAFVGAGNMARSLIAGLRASAKEPLAVRVSDANAAALEALQTEPEFGATEFFSLTTLPDNRSVCDAADVVVLAVKPDVVRAVCGDIAAVVTDNTLVISVAAGIRIGDMQRWLQRDAAVVRCMPNTPALYGFGSSGLFAAPGVSDAQRQLAQTMLGAVGICRWLESEVALDAITALSGSGPAYFFHLIECMAATAEEMGIDAETASAFATETAYGAAYMARHGTDSPTLLRQKVTSKGGTTAAALATFAEHDFPAIVSRAMQAAADRADELGELLGNDSNT